jgi:uncharacterized protein involved in outer membrane biogenesis
MKKWILRGLIVVVVLLVVAIIAVGFFLDGAIKKGIETFGPELTKVSIKLDSVKVSIFSGSGGIKGLVVGNPEGFKTAHAISVGTASLGLSPGSLLSDKVVIKHVHVESPEITFEGGLKESNLSKILDNLNAAAGGSGDKPADPKASGPGKKLQVDDFTIKGAKVNISLTGMGGKVIPVTLPDIHLTNLGSGPDGITAAELSKRVMSEIVSAASTAATSDTVKNLSKGATDAVKDAGSKATDAIKGVGDLFKKKD